MSTKPRQYDLMLLGATGYTGRPIAEYITKNLPKDLNWAVAGRNAEKLQALVSKSHGTNQDRQQPAIEVSGFSKTNVDALVRKTRVLISVVGPYHRHGTPIIEACAAAGTHYLDNTGELPQVV